MLYPAELPVPKAAGNLRPLPRPLSRTSSNHENKAGHPNGHPALAEREGFEPSVSVNLHSLSRRAPSATRSPLQDPKLSNLGPKNVFGGGGIRTPGSSHYGGFQDRCLQPLGHSSSGYGWRKLPDLSPSGKERMCGNFRSSFSASDASPVQHSCDM